MYIVETCVLYFSVCILTFPDLDGADDPEGSLACPARVQDQTKYIYVSTVVRVSRFREGKLITRGGNAAYTQMVVRYVLLLQIREGSFR